MHCVRWAAIAAITLLLAAPAARAGWLIEQKETIEGQKSRTVRISIDKDRMKTDVEEEGSSIIVDFRKNVMYTVTHAQKVFFRMDINEMIRQMKELSAQFGEQPDQGAGAIYSIKVTGATETVAGFPCRRVDLLRDGARAEEYCVSDRIATADLLASIRKFSELGALGSAESRRAVEQIDSILKMGYPVRRVLLPAGPEMPRQTTVLTAARSTPFAEGVFLPPTGYREQSMMEMMMDLGAVEGEPELKGSFPAESPEPVTPAGR